ncbi:BRCA1-associated protein 2-domain-containing protein [Cokeromyces recurvatus]|uniref:BRCA1-associated protein 2-domain-containing protein n=1 Tax=Cokeromyces recurvatus TaxID=90255 RepID=UPI00221F0D54|nr:BRCA1-associated protein 2-domain-containing protein [Cokeromyces recurvatus]KAI7900546.1 BRCA1-associated protein 2-domain-containing protein [Cokeromyces recurvatus]
MYYYQLKCVLYTPEQITFPSNFFSHSFPTINPVSIDFFDDYRNKSLISSSSSSSLQRRPSQHPIKHVPPTPISHTTTSNATENTYLKNHTDFRLGSIHITSIDKQNKKKQWHLGYGILHLYRSMEETEPDSDTLCILAVPSYMTDTDFIQFVGSHHKSHILQYRFIKDYSPNKYTVLVKFDSRASAHDFYNKFNGRRFNMTEPEISHVVYIQRQSIESIHIAPHTYPHMNETLGPPTDTELPTCPTCLERLDETVTGLKPIQCHHIATQCVCLDKWGQNQCPICQYSQRPTHQRPLTKSLVFDRQNCCCFQCGSSTCNLWICMICGHIGCGRYQSAHAYHHYRDCQHSYALEIDTQRVWDYVQDGYVHRLIQNTVDGGLVELPSMHRTTQAPETSSLSNTSTTSDNHEKLMDSLSADHTYMMTSQLDSQRIYYEEQLEGLMKQLTVFTNQIKSIHDAIEEGKEKYNVLLDRNVSLDMAMEDLKKDKEKVDKRIQNYKEKYKVMQKNLAEEKLVNKQTNKQKGNMSKHILITGFFLLLLFSFFLIYIYLCTYSLRNHSSKIMSY